MSLSDDSIIVLLIEDDLIDIRTIEYGFKKNNIGNTLVVAKNGVDALNRLRGKHPSKLSSLPKIILLDINMPQMTGFEFLKKLKAEPKFAAIPTFIITTSDSDEDKKSAEAFSVTGYFEKPLNFTEFFPIYKKIIES